jgi:hypothetical protein
MWFYEESKFGLLMVKGEQLQRGNVSTMIIGATQTGQRKTTDFS